MTSKNKVPGRTYYFHNGWKFLLADEFPMEKALKKTCDESGHYFYEKEFTEQNWEEVTLPHTFNDKDLFRDRIQDGGSGQKRTASLYRRWFSVPEQHQGQKVLIEFEGLRQTCYLYINGKMAGYYEAGVAPFGFDLTPWICYDAPNLIAVATDNTSTRNIDLCIGETPNKPDAVPGSYLLAQDQEEAGYKKGVGFFWNCNDFNPSIGGITRPVKLHFKPEVYLTLPLYSNLRTKGVYIYGQNYRLDEKSVQIGAEAEIRNEGRESVTAWLEITVRDLKGTEVLHFLSEKQQIAPSGEIRTELSVTPEDAYIWDNDADQYVPVDDEKKVMETVTDSRAVSVIPALSPQTKMRFWSMEDPYLYRLEVQLYADGQQVDDTVIETGFRSVGYHKDKGILVNGVPVWLTGYAQRAANEWAAIGIAPEWLKDQDAMWIRESNSNHLRFMHVAASPADIRSCDRHGIVCTQPAGDKERENFGRQWDQRIELMRDVIIFFRNNPSVFFWEAGNNSINREHMKEMRLLKEKLDPKGGRFMGCRTLNTEDVVMESEYVGTMLNRHAARFLAEHGPVTETEYAREEAPRRIWDDFTPPDFDYKNKWLGKGGKKQVGMDFYDLTSEEFALTAAKGYSEFFHDRIGGASEKKYYSACAALCWTDSAQHGRQSFSENGRMSGRVDPVRIKKQNFDVFSVMQSPVPRIGIIGHWNYPPEDGINYRYMEKSFNGSYWEENGIVKYRDPRHKTVYVTGSYSIKRIELFVNGKRAGTCEKPQDTFIFAFPNVDVTQSGVVEAYGYDYDDRLAARDEIHTAGDPFALRLGLHTSPKGMYADGADIAYIDVEVVDKEGRICPLCEARIDFSIEGEGTFLGGYNSGRFAGFGRENSVIHENHVYSECGVNRVFVRATRRSGVITLKALMEGVPQACIRWESCPADLSPLTEEGPVGWYQEYSLEAPEAKPAFSAIPMADACKYQPEDQEYCKILVNGQEPDTRGVRSVNKNGSIWGAVLCILERLKAEWGDEFSYTYMPEEEKLVLVSGDNSVEAEAGRTHLLVNGKENLMDGEPYVTPEGNFVMEVNALVPYICGVTAFYDEKVGVYRIETGK